MTRQEYNQLNSDGRVACPDCGLPYTTPYPGCHCPPSPTGYGTRHINEWHHDCTDAKRLEAERLSRTANASLDRPADSAGTVGGVVRFRWPRRKCAYCGQWIKRNELSVLLPTHGVYRSESHFAHGNCQSKANTRPHAEAVADSVHAVVGNSGGQQ